VLKAEGAAESMIIQADASAAALSQIDSALKKEGGLEAAQFLLGQRYMDAYKQVGQKGTTVIIPSEPIKVGHQVNESLSFFKNIQPL
jgi:regulator of protease activity HflC (stomatin/prohibitin superfamily)